MEGEPMFKSKRKKQKKETAPKIPKTLSDSIPYERVYKNGVIEIQSCVFSKSYILPSVNYKTRGSRVQGSMAELYAEMIGSFDPDITVEITIYNKTIDIMEFQESVLLKPNRDGLDKYRIEYNNMLIDKMVGAKNNLESQKIITISFYATDIESANERFQQVESTMAEYLTDLTKKDMKEMSLIERLDMLNSIYNQNSDAHLYEKRMIDGKEVESFSLENCEAQGITTKDVIAPGGMEITNDQINMDGVIAKSYYISNYPTWLKDTILTDFASIPTNMLVSVYFNTIAQEEAIKLVRRQGTNIRSEIVNIQKRAARSGYDASLINPDVQDSQREVGEMANDITKENRKLFVANIVITLFASSKEELENYEKQLKALQTKHMVTVKQLYLQQEAGFNTALPLGNNQLEIQRLMSSDSVSVITPFDMKNIKQKTGMYYGINATTRDMILYDRTTDLNPNGAILGMSGAGKSFTSKREIINVLLNTNDEVYVIDPEGIDYTPLADALGGSAIKIANGSNVYINPFDLNIENAGADGNPVKVKTDFITTICEIAIGGKYGLSPNEKSIIDRCVESIYDDYIQYLKDTGKTFDVDHAPTMVDFWNQLNVYPEREAAQLALSLERYVNGSLDIFSKHTNVEINNRFTVYNIKDIGEGLKELGLQICLDNIWNKMIENQAKGKRTWIYIDEFYLLMQKPSSASYIAQIWKRARKWNGVPTAITQNIEDLLKNEDARTILNNCSFMILLGQSPMNQIELSKMFNISKDEQKYISAAKPGMGLIRIKDDIIPMDDSFPQDTKLYKIMSTKPDES